MTVFMVAGLLCGSSSSLTLQAGMLLASMARTWLCICLQSDVLACMSGALWSELSQQPARLQAASKAMREREAALLTVQAMQADLVRKKSALSTLTQGGQQVSASVFPFLALVSMRFRGPFRADRGKSRELQSIGGVEQGLQHAHERPVPAHAWNNDERRARALAVDLSPGKWPHSSMWHAAWCRLG